MGASCAIAAVVIWAGWLVMMRLGVTTRLSAPDLTALRFAVAGPVLLPIVLRRGLAIDRLGWSGFAAVVAGAGAPVALVIGAGLQFAPVAHAGALYQGTVPLATACLAAVVLQERVTAIRKPGFLLIVCGGVMIGGLGLSSLGGGPRIGHLLFLSASCMTACYTVAIRYARVDGYSRLPSVRSSRCCCICPFTSPFSRTDFSKCPWPILCFRHCTRAC
jgi:drug/metabolite transporter (DMT)-like permease